jgi:hypothetical protein
MEDSCTCTDIEVTIEDFGKCSPKSVMRSCEAPDVTDIAEAEHLPGQVPPFIII